MNQGFLKYTKNTNGGLKQGHIYKFLIVQNIKISVYKYGSC